MADRNPALAKQLNERVQTHDDGTREYWRDVVRWEGKLRISDRGRVKSLGYTVKCGFGFRTVEQGIVDLFTMRSGYKSCKAGLVHRLVLAAFVGPCPEGMQCRHLDGSRDNNCLDNLCWGTPEEDAADKLRHGTQPFGEHCYQAKLRDDQIPLIHKRYANGETPEEIGRALGVSPTSVLRIVRGRVYKAAQPKTKAKLRGRGCSSGKKNGNSRLIAFQGRSMILKDWAAEIGITAESLHGRILSWGVERALTTPRCRRKSKR